MLELLQTSLLHAASNLGILRPSADSLLTKARGTSRHCLGRAALASAPRHKQWQEAIHSNRPEMVDCHFRPGTLEDQVEGLSHASKLKRLDDDGSLNGRRFFDSKVPEEDK